MKLLFFWIFTMIGRELTFALQFGRAVFNNTPSGIQGSMTLLPTLGNGTYMIGQLQNITCANSTLNPTQALFPNSCRIGVTINNLAQNPSATQNIAFRLQTFNISTVNLPNIGSILSSSLIGVNTTAGSSMNKIPMTGNCENIGGIYNPLQNLTAGPLGLLNPRGIIGNILVTGGIGTMMLGPIELFLTGPLSVMGLPLVIWRDAIQLFTNGSLNTLNGNSNRILACATIMPMNDN